MADYQAQLDFLKLHQANENKHAYFLLASAAAGIAFAVQKTTGVPLHKYHLILGAAIALWAASFWAGCRQLYWVQACLSANFTILKLQAGNHETQPPTPELLAAAIRGTETALKSNAKNASCYSKWQFRLLVSGAVVFIAWHVYEMYLLTIST